MADADDSDAVWTRNEIASPCIKICMLHPEARICVGCYRTGEEIARWASYSPAERARLMEDLPGRAAQLTRRSGGRAARRARAER